MHSSKRILPKNSSKPTMDKTTEKGLNRNLNTEIIYEPTEQDLIRAADLLRKGGLVATPTETVYGLGVNALDSEAAKKVYAAKGRPSDNPLIIHLAYAKDAEKYCCVNDAFRKLAEHFMPGPITIILPKKECIPDSVTGGLSTVAVRVPSHPIAHRLIELAGIPIAAPSANLSGKPSTTTVEHVIEDMNGRIDIILDGGPCSIGLESTIVIPHDDYVQLLRPGAITVEMLEAVGFRVDIDKAVTEKLAEGERPLAPGMKYRHYAPQAQVYLLKGSQAQVDDFMRPLVGLDEVALLCRKEDAAANAPNAYLLGSRECPEEQAEKLFALLRDFDHRHEIKRIFAVMPSSDGIGLAMMNRMLKASGYQVIKLD